jgi:hypothetical protein
MTDTTTEIVDETEQSETVEETGYTPPFLRITGRYPVGDGGNYQVVELEINLRDDDTVGEYDPAGAGAAKSWLTDLCLKTIAELRRPPAPTGILLTGAAAREVFGHADDCGGDCGDQMPLINRDLKPSDATVGHPGSDRWTGGDRKDAN